MYGMYLYLERGLQFSSLGHLLLTPVGGVQLHELRFRRNHYLQYLHDISVFQPHYDMFRGFEMAIFTCLPKISSGNGVVTHYLERLIDHKSYLGTYLLIKVWL